MKKRNVIRLTSFLLAAIIVAIGFIVKSQQKINRYELALKNGYSRSLDEFAEAINNISLTLNKARFVTTPQQISSMAAKLLAEAEYSKSALSQLPTENELSSLNRFLSQVGNYALSVSRELISGGEIKDESRENIEKLSKTATKIADLVSSVQAAHNNAEYWAEELDKKVDETVQNMGVSASFDEIEGEFSDYPTLVYDGPYSDHILEKEPTMIKNAAEVSEKKALEVAAQTVECEEKELNYDGFVLGSIPAYRFMGSGVTASVSKNGGYAVFMRKDRAVGDSLLSYEQAREKAKRYLERIKMTNLLETYYFCSEGVCVFNFAFVDGETICYTDLIKVGVAMDNGEIMLYEASGYLSNHTERAFETPVYREDQAERVVSESLTINSTALALIPTRGKNEARCYEFACTSLDGQEILVYINTQTLAEEEVLILLKSDGGTLVK